jgi:hypothetical protein
VYHDGEKSTKFEGLKDSAVGATGTGLDGVGCARVALTDKEPAMEPAIMTLANNGTVTPL